MLQVGTAVVGDLHTTLLVSLEATVLALDALGHETPQEVTAEATPATEFESNFFTFSLQNYTPKHVLDIIRVVISILHNLIL